MQLRSGSAFDENVPVSNVEFTISRIEIYCCRFLTLDSAHVKLVSLAAVFSIVTQRDTKNGCEGD